MKTKTTFGVIAVILSLVVLWMVSQNRRARTCLDSAGEERSALNSSSRVLPFDSAGSSDVEHAQNASRVKVGRKDVGAVGHTEPVVAQDGGRVSALNADEQRSLWKAFAEARREVSRIPEARADRAENAGFDFYAINHAQRLTARFSAAGMRLSSSDKTYTEKDQKSPHTAWQATMVLERFAGETLRSYPRPQKPEPHSNKVVYQHSATLSEWYVNGSEGIEHGYTITRRPTGLASGQAVTLGIALDGLKAIASEDAGSLTLVDGKRTVLSYSKLKVVDTRGRELPATMQATANGIQLAYQDTNAHYPVTVDPLIASQEQKLSVDDAATGDKFGNSVAISGDTVVIGVSRDDDGGADSGSAYVFMRSENSWGFQQKLTASDAAADDQFGNAVAISGNTVVVGAKHDDDGGTDSGSAYVFTRTGSTWSEQAKLTAGDAAQNDRFGNAVAISGDTVVVGAYMDDHDSKSNAGSTYVFIQSGSAWSQQAKLTADDAAQNDNFGNAVAISGDTVIVGAYWDDDGGVDSGSAYVFTRSGVSWSQPEKITAGDAAQYDNFGNAVAISGNTVVVGANHDGHSGKSNAGSAYIFNRNTGSSSWAQTQKITAGDAAEDDEFGGAVAISDTTVVVGAQWDYVNVSGSGSAYIFFRTGIAWYQQAKLTASDAASDDHFGHAVAISGDSVIVGAYWDDDGGANSGSSYIFIRDTSNNTWSEQQKLTADDTDANNELGYALALTGETAVIGMWKDDALGLDSGAAYIFTRVGAVWSIEQKLTAGDGMAEDFFGISVGISGESVVIGAYKGDVGALGDAGAAYVFTRNEGVWSEQQKLTASDADANDLFGRAVGISGDRVIVGAYKEDAGGNNAGAAYVFGRSGSAWSELQKLIAYSPSANDQFGRAVAISGDTAVVGAWFDDVGAVSDCGSVSVFNRSGNIWATGQFLTASDKGAGDFFGASLAILGDSLVVGAYKNDDSGNDSGSAYVFTRSGNAWSQQQKLLASDGQASDRFGYSVALSSESVLVGAYQATSGGTAAGATYVFTRAGTTWTQGPRLSASDPASGDQFGYSVALSGDTAIVGAAHADVGSASNAGAVYVFRLTLSGEKGLLVFDHLGQGHQNGESAPAFPAQALGTSSPSYTFRITNNGTLPLNLQAVAIKGTDASEFSLSLPSIAADPDLAQGESIECTVTFSPDTSSSGMRNAYIEVKSDWTTGGYFTLNISGLGLSPTSDADGDGMSDWLEYTLRGFGFDWEKKQSNKVADYYQMAGLADLQPLSQIPGIGTEGSVVPVDPASHTSKLVIELQKSLNLNGFSHIVLDPTKLSVDANGKIRYEANATESKKFFRARFK